MFNPIPQPQPARNDRGTGRQQIHPGYLKATQAKPDTPAEIYAYPAFMRAIGPRLRPLTIPVAFPTPAATRSQGWLRPVFAIVLLGLWFVGANVTPGV